MIHLCFAGKKRKFQKFTYRQSSFTSSLDNCYLICNLYINLRTDVSYFLRFSREIKEMGAICMRHSYATLVMKAITSLNRPIYVIHLCGAKLSLFSRGNNFQLIETSRPQELTEPAFFVSRVARQHDVKRNTSCQFSCQFSIGRKLPECFNEDFRSNVDTFSPD